MASLSSTVERVRGVTLVELAVSNEGARARVRIANLLDGPVWPPRRRGVPERGWDDDGVTVTLEAGGARALGYATPAAPSEPAAAIAKAEPAPTEEGRFEPAPEVPAVDPTPGGVVRALADPRPPRDAVPAGGRADAGGSATTAPVGDPAEPVTTDTATDPGDPVTPGTSVAAAESATTEPAVATDVTGAADVAVAPDPPSAARPSSRPTPVEEPPAGVPGPDRDWSHPPDRDGSHPPDPPAAVDAWLAAVDRRVARAEALVAADGLADAGDRLARVGGIEGAARVDSRLDGDGAALRQVARRAADLADRATGLDVPLAAYERLAGGARR